MLFSSLLPLLLYHNMSSLEAGQTESFLHLPSLEIAVRKKSGSPRDYITVDITQEHISSPPFNTAAFLLLSGKPTLQYPSKERCFYLPQFTLLKFYRRVSVELKNSIQQVIGVNIMEILK